jgi:hypothetical protein
LTFVSGDGFSSGSDMGVFMSYGDGPYPAGPVTAHTWTGMAYGAANSSGFMVAIALIDSTPDDSQTEILRYTRER